MIQADPSGRFVLHADLGLDTIFIWRFDDQRGTLTPNDPPSVSLPAGDGPRHFHFHPNGRWFYSIQEESSTIAVFAYDSRLGRLTRRQTISTLPLGFAGSNFCSEILVSADGRYMYAGNRLHDSIGILSVGSDGRLTYVGEAWTRGDYPRSFSFDPTGRFLYCANQRADAVTVFRVDRASGRLSFTGQHVPVGNPSSIVFVDLARRDDLRGAGASLHRARHEEADPGCIMRADEGTMSDSHDNTKLDRRTFLTAGVVAGSAIASSALSYGRILGANDRIGLGHIGVGNRGSGLHMMTSRLKDQYQVETVAVCDLWTRNRDRAVANSERYYGHAPRAFQHLEELLALKEVDAVLIATPEHSHSPVLKAAVEAGKDAYCEKPMGNVLQEVKAARDAVKQSRRVVQIGTQHRSEPYQLAAREVIRSGALGEVSKSRSCGTTTAHAGAGAPK